MLSPANAEVRFVIEGEKAAIALSGTEPKTEGLVFFGDFFGNQRFTLGGEPTEVSVSRAQQLEPLPREVGDKLAFSPRVCRLLLPHLCPTARLHGVEGQVRPPSDEEKPSLRMLAYGTSITHGAFASAPHLTYAAQTAWRLKADLVNLGVGGSCVCEPELADYIAGRRDWDFATLCLSVNMLGHGYTAGDFRRRASYFVRRLAESGPQRLVACITLLPFFGDLGETRLSDKSTSGEYREALREVVGGLGLENVVLIEGPDLLSNWGGLTADLIHPGDHGMMEVAEKLAARLRPLLPADTALGRKSHPQA
jgi:hypothetical protein